MIEFFGHPFSSYTWKALIALYETGAPFSYRIIDSDHPENFSALQAISPQGKFPAIVDGGASLFEASIIIDYLDQHYPGPTRLIPDDPTSALNVRMIDRFFDNYVMTPMQRIVGDFIRAPDDRDATTVAEAHDMLRRSYTWLEPRLADKAFACGDNFTLADCAAAPSLFYADWVCEIAPGQRNLKAYRARLLARPSVKRCIDDARPYRHFFPPGAPDRD
jgi:glutathione S-transferase